MRRKMPKVKMCPKINTCYKIKIILDKDLAGDWQYALCMRQVCQICKERKEDKFSMAKKEVCPLFTKLDVKCNDCFPIIVCLCGSTRFGEAFQRAQFDETMAGKIVLTIGCNMKSDKELFKDYSETELKEIKTKLDELHKRKIDLADEILFLNVGRYMGESTLKELQYAVDNHKIIRFLEPN
jgi:hypothetical protein